MTETLPAAETTWPQGIAKPTNSNAGTENMKTLKDLFMGEFSDIYDAERQMVKALPHMAKAVTCDEMKQVIQSRLVEAEGNLRILNHIFHGFEEKAKGRTHQATTGFLEKKDEIAASHGAFPTLNAALISAEQKADHHEIASYGYLHEQAGLEENDKAALRDCMSHSGPLNRWLC